MTGKTDMVPVLNLPSHLSQPSQSENVPIFDSGTRCYFAPENHGFGANSRKEKGNSQPRRTSRQLPAVLPPVGRFEQLSEAGRPSTPPGDLNGIWAAFREDGKPTKERQEKEPGTMLPRLDPLLPAVRAVSGFLYRGQKSQMPIGIKSGAIRVWKTTKP